MSSADVQVPAGCQHGSLRLTDMRYAAGQDEEYKQLDFLKSLANSLTVSKVLECAETAHHR